MEPQIQTEYQTKYRSMIFQELLLYLVFGLYVLDWYILYRREVTNWCYFFQKSILLYMWNIIEILNYSTRFVPV